MPTTKYVIAALGRGYLQDRNKDVGEFNWTEDRDLAWEWESRADAAKQLKQWKKVKGFPASAEILPGPHVS